MNRHSELINERYEAMMFAKDAEVGRKAARALVRLVLGDEALNQPLEEALRETCRKLRPSTDPRHLTTQGLHGLRSTLAAEQAPGDVFGRQADDATTCPLRPRRSRIPSMIKPAIVARSKAIEAA